MGEMTRRRFMILAVTLVVLNAAFWLAQGGFALPGTILNEFFGNRMVRAEVLVQAPDGSIQDYRVDRGSIVSFAGGTLTLREKDGTMATVQVDANTLVLGAAGRTLPQTVLRRRLRVVAFHLASGSSAQQIVVEGIG
jgi:hypothetical protein